MTDALSAEALMAHVRALAEEIGPRPAGHPEEAAARVYVRGALARLGIAEVEELPFPTPDTWGYGQMIPLSLALVGNILGWLGRLGRLAGGLAALGAAYTLWQNMSGRRQPLAALNPVAGESATLIARIPAAGPARRTVVLLGHTDTNKHRLTFAPEFKRLILPMTTMGFGAAALNGLAQVAQALGVGRAAEWLRRLSMVGMATGLLTLIADESGGFIDGANDNATAVACLLGLGAQLQQQPLQHTEVWLAFTGAEEVGCLGTHALLDAYGDRLTDAWFIDFEMVGTDDIAYVTRHTALLPLGAYRPDPESLALAQQTARAHPELAVQGREMVILEEVGSLRSRGFRGICLVGVGADGWLAQWHQYADNAANIRPAGMERAARFAWEMIRALDGA